LKPSPCGGFKKTIFFGDGQKAERLKINYFLVAVCNEPRNLSGFGLLIDESFNKFSDFTLLVSREA